MFYWINDGKKIQHESFKGFTLFEWFKAMMLIDDNEKNNLLAKTLAINEEKIK